MPCRRSASRGTELHSACCCRQESTCMCAPSHTTASSVWGFRHALTVMMALRLNCTLLPFDNAPGRTSFGPVSFRQLQKNELPICGGGRNSTSRQFCRAERLKAHTGKCKRLQRAAVTFCAQSLLYFLTARYALRRVFEASGTCKVSKRQTLQAAI